MRDEPSERIERDDAAPAPPRASAAAHLASIDALRAIACLWVVLYHVGMWWLGAFWSTFDGLAREYGAAARPFVWLTRLGFQGVGLFLVLSGFCLYYPLVRRAGVAGASLSLGEYARRRAGRILPAYYVSMLLLWALASWPLTRAVVMRPITHLDLWTHALLVHNLVPESLWTMNGAYWSLALEAQLYVVFPLLVLLGRRAGPWAIGALGLAVSALWPLALDRAGLGQVTGELYGVWFESLPGRLGEFTAGMVAAAIVAEGRASRLPRWALALLALLWAPASHAVSVAHSVTYPIDKIANAISFASLIVLATRLPLAWWRWAPLRALGAIGATAYSLYLVHQPMLLLLRIPVWEIPASQHRHAMPFLVAGGVALSLVCGAAFYVLVERPFEQWRRPARSSPKP